MNPTTQLLSRDMVSRAVARVLIVDDEPHVLAVGKAVLESHGFETVACRSGEEALELVRTGLEDGQRFSVAILDLTMPGGASGFEVLEWLRACDPRLPVIACSGYFQEDVKDLCQAIGFVDVLHKPFNLESLGLAVRRAMVQEPEAAESGYSGYQPGAIS
ncbi:response regulator [Prosthecobacter vanneervenii]|uniref:CheY-like chemotaxis protein n=1 Tax=Prosthecobacter vanneervenii TaxID=48466 RepID=A0A7W8DJ78_9BACT|nr:response regulator [Prosthecobacter vanneervenii]MBB5031745.1 CheY-like chemotaxis protein [Prosthecobacter vanneervenii]